jgi:hypothetical protein
LPLDVADTFSKYDHDVKGRTHTAINTGASERMNLSQWEDLEELEMWVKRVVKGDPLISSQDQLKSATDHMTDNVVSS